MFICKLKQIYACEQIDTFIIYMVLRNKLQ